MILWVRNLGKAQMGSSSLILMGLAECWRSTPKMASSPSLSAGSSADLLTRVPTSGFSVWLGSSHSLVASE